MVFIQCSRGYGRKGLDKGRRSKLVHAVKLLVCIREVTDSNTGQDTYPKGFRHFPQYLQAKAGMVP